MRWCTTTQLLITAAPSARITRRSSSPATLLTEQELLPHLFREEDGYFRWEIVLSPFAVTDRETVIEVLLRDPDWTDKVLTGKHAFPHEPFQLHGPAKPFSCREGDPMPMVSLPKLRTGNLFTE
jgi:hypothetical protein